MGRFSDEEREALQANVHVVYATEREVVFTEDFKRLAWREKRTGKNMPTIFRENGIDPEVLGKKRVENFNRRLRDRARNEESFADGRQENHRPKVEDRGLEEKLRRLEHELAYARQEVEFLKKLQAANTEARKSWESKHRRK